jgi:hypothetical protein
LRHDPGRWPRFPEDVKKVKDLGEKVLAGIFLNLESALKCVNKEIVKI